MLKMNKYSLILLLLFACSAGVRSQNNVAVSNLDSNVMLVGDQVNLSFSFSSKKAVPVLFPIYCDTCIEGIEIVKRSGIDTVSDENGYKLTQQFTITSFDSGEYVIPPIPFYSLDSVLLAETEALLLTVRTIAVDTNLTIKDIKAPLSAPITIREILPYLGIVLLAIGLIVGIIFLIRYVNNRKKPQPAARPKPEMPAHLIALQALDALWQKKLYQSGYIKQYYSELTDIVRTYIENRWDIAAMEMVSSEIITALSPLDIPEEAIQKLERTLFLSDMVKFAKSNPLADESAASYQYIVDFVQTTKPLTTNH